MAVINKKVKTVVVLFSAVAVWFVARSPSSPSLSSLFQTPEEAQGFAGFEFVRLCIAALTGFAVYAAASLLLELHSDEMLYHKEVEIVKRRKPSSLPKVPVEGFPSSINPATDLAEKTIFLTGATGFLGKIVLEKILRDIPKIKNIIVLVRSTPKDGQTRKDAACERFEKDVLSTPVFKKLKETFGDKFNDYIAQKTTVVAGDLGDKKMCMDDSDFGISQEVDVIIHCAANTRFDDPVKKMVQSNVVGSVNVIEFAKILKKSPPVSYVSTAYSNSNIADHILERQYPLPFDAQKMADAILSSDESSADTTFAGAMEFFPNQYTFSKALAEACVFQARGNVRVAVVRPTVIGPTMKEPFPGWIDTIFGAGMSIAAIATATPTKIPGRGDCIIDFVPADLVVNTIIVNTTCLVKSETYGATMVPIYHSGTGHLNPVTLHNSINSVLEHSRNDTSGMFPKSPKFSPDDPSWWRLWFLFRYLVPVKIGSLLADNVAAPLGLRGLLRHYYSASRSEKQLDRLKKFTKAFYTFWMTTWVFDMSNVVDMENHLESEARDRFYTNPKILVWHDWWKAYVDRMAEILLEKKARWKAREEASKAKRD
eukprot:CAMPEP_0113887424 /NCGR_PEP_ID=MMETSP0780_2-20120614/12206_1 /TAXON_ID=652834 /ORGANISM="Palpitomonas bilix" /LENGTH=596 /DNA_ID=CAMNT_0000875955 /DNA_START=64 /DNA_END=1854 /DNA_ORIENTATION=- /assembly_acc=CAM_ASM_000599